MKPFIYILLLACTQLSLAQEAGTRSLSQKAMDAYALKSESKVREFFNYLELLSDPKLNDDMKAQTISEALSLFKDNAAITDNIFDKKRSPIALKTLMKEASSKKKKITFTVSAFNAMLQDQTPTQQKWQITYELTVNDTATITITQDFLVIYEDKQFGKTIRKVWNTFLGTLNAK